MGNAHAQHRHLDFLQELPNISYHNGSHLFVILLADSFEQYSPNWHFPRDPTLNQLLHAIELCHVTLHSPIRKVPVIT